MINVHHSTFDMNHQVINPKESTKVHLRNFTPPLHGLCFIPPVAKKYPASRRIVPCRNPGLNRGPLDLQSNALPTELFRLTMILTYYCAFIGRSLHCLPQSDRLNCRLIYPSNK